MLSCQIGYQLSKVQNFKHLYPTKYILKMKVGSKSKILILIIIQVQKIRQSVWAWLFPYVRFYYENYNVQNYTTVFPDNGQSVMIKSQNSALRGILMNTNVAQEAWILESTFMCTEVKGTWVIELSF